MSPHVVIVVLNWNNAPDTLACLDSLQRLDDAERSILVVDNGSTDDSVQRIRERHPNLTLIETGQNLGYAGGNNVGIRHALAQGADYVCILNNDVVVDIGFLKPLVTCLAQEGDVGIACPTIADMSTPERIWALGASMLWRSGAPTRLFDGICISSVADMPAFDVDIAPGTAMLIKTEVFERVGLLDEAFFLYYEEMDWCLQVRKQGYRICAVPSAIVWHKVSATLGASSPVVDYYMCRNGFRFLARNESGIRRLGVLGRAACSNLRIIAAYTVKPHGGRRIPHRNARLLALRDAALGRWGKMGADVEAVCYPEKR